MNLDYDLPVTENTTYNLADSQLFIKLPATYKKNLGFSELNLTANGGDIFNSERLGFVEFFRNEQLQISGLKFKDVGRLRNILWRSL